MTLDGDRYAEAFREGQAVVLRNLESSYRYFGRARLAEEVTQHAIAIFRATTTRAR